MDELTRRVRRYMEKENMAERGSRIVAAVSGGADSVCLLHVLARLAPEMEWQLAAVHVNHRIRAEAGEDAAYVEALCRDLGIPFFLKEADVEALAKEWGMSAEEAGRRVRYQAFEEAAGQFGADRIAVAHNRNDRAETLLFHLFRGTGLAGMASIRPVRDRIIRPLLTTGREEIERWLAAEEIPFCTDRTNHTDEYTRNRIRRHILPYAKEAVCAEADVHLAQEAELLAETADFVMRRTEEALARCVVKDDADVPGLCDMQNGTDVPRLRGMQKDAGGTGLRGMQNGTDIPGLRGIQDRCSATPAEGNHNLRIRVNFFLQEDPFLQTHMLLLALKQLSAGGKDIGMTHVQDVRTLFSGQSGRKIILPYHLEAVRSFDEVVIRAKRTEKTGEIDRSFQDGNLLPRQPDSSSCGNQQPPEEAGKISDLKPILDREGRLEIHVPGLGTVEYSLENWEKSHVIQEKTYTKWLDYDRIKCLVMRSRQPGDYLMINDRLQKKSLKEYMIQEKIPADERADIPLLADGNHILWVVGHRISSAVKVGENTKRVLRIDIRGGKENG